MSIYILRYLHGGITTPRNFVVHFFFFYFFLLYVLFILGGMADLLQSVMPHDDLHVCAIGILFSLYLLYPSSPEFIKSIYKKVYPMKSCFP